MRERCVDASVGVKWLIHGEPLRAEAIRLLQDAKAAAEPLIAPPLLEYEIESSLQSKVIKGTLSLPDADAALQYFSSLAVQFITVPGMVRRAREIARQFNERKIYDSLYAALAELRGCEFWTADFTFYNKVSATLPFVKALSNYP